LLISCLKGHKELNDLGFVHNDKAYCIMFAAIYSVNNTIKKKLKFNKTANRMLTKTGLFVREDCQVYGDMIVFCYQLPPEEFYRLEDCPVVDMDINFKELIHISQLKLKKDKENLEDNIKSIYSLMMTVPNIIVI